MDELCRICFQKNNLISKFCKCKGSIGFIHETCLKKTIEINGNKCGVCNSYFDNKLLFITFFKRVIKNKLYIFNRNIYKN